MNRNNKNIRRDAVYLLFVGLLLHIFVVHVMFKSSVVGLDNGMSPIEYTFDGTSNAAHNNVLSAKQNKTDNSKYLSLPELYDSNNDILIKELNNIIVKTQIIAEVSFYTTANEVHPIFYTNLTPNNSTLLTQFKTVSLLI